MPDNPYKRYCMHVLVRILSNLDRDPMSPTYGSFDRSYWNYKIRDFSSAVLQQGCLSLSIVYKNNFEGNIYFNNPKIKEYAAASIKYWSKIQHKDGSFDEYWANEKSIPSTAFSLYAICESCEILGFKDEKVFESIRKAVDFLKNHTERGALNQEMASTTAIMYAGKILNDESVKRIARKKFDSLLLKQSSEGWYSEYNGVDIGYLTINLDFLVRYYELTKDKRAIESAGKIVNFVKYFVHPDGSIGGEYCTRNTEYFIPYGLEFMKRHEPIAGTMIEKLMSYINLGEYLNSCIDERYVLHYVTHSFLKSLVLYEKNKEKEALPFEENFDKYFDEAMIYIKSTPDYYFICSFMKGGVFKIMDKKKFIMHTDAGYRVRYKGSLCVSEWPNKNKFKLDKNSITVKSYFMKKKFFVQSPLKQTVIKLISSFIGDWVVSLSKKILIYGKNKPIKDMGFKRRVVFEDSSLTVYDEIFAGDREVEALRMNGLSMRHTASSKFFQINSLGNKIQQDKFSFKRKKKISTRIKF
jgi:hypothetical protein